jgi:hypothetical protein
MKQIVLLTILIVLSACTMTKKVHSKGYYIEWKNQRKTTDSYNLIQIMDKVQSTKSEESRVEKSIEATEEKIKEPIPLEINKEKEEKVEVTNPVNTSSKVVDECKNETTIEKDNTSKQKEDDPVKTESEYDPVPDILAIASGIILILGILSVVVGLILLFKFGLLEGIGLILSLSPLLLLLSGITGVVSLIVSRNHKEEQEFRWMASFGAILGILGFLLIIASILFILFIQF